MRAPTKTVMTVARSPIDIEMRAPWTVRLRMSRPSSSVPKMCAADGGSSAVPDAVMTVSSGPTNSCGRDRQHGEEEQDDQADDAVAAPPNRPHEGARALRARAASARTRRLAATPRRAPVSVALMRGPAGRGGHRSRSAAKLAMTTVTDRSRKMPCRTG